MDHARKSQELEMAGAGLPARRRSPLWAWAQEISRRRAEGYSYAQIAGALSRAGHPVSPRWLRRWCRAHLGPVRKAPMNVRQQPGPAPGANPASAEVAHSATPSNPSLADAYGPEPSDILSGLRPQRKRK